MSLQIVKIDISSLQAPLLQPFRIATGQHDQLDNLLVTLELSDGTVGYGEAAIASHITGETIDQTKENLLATAQCLEHHDAADYLRISFWLHDSFPLNKAAVAAVEMALLDALTRSMKIPLWKLFGNKAHRLKTDITIVIASLEETQAKAKEFYQKGFRSFKIKIGRDMDLDFKRVQVVAKMAPQSQIILDANQGYDAAGALKFLKMLDKAKVKVDVIEQPVAKADLEGLKRVTKLSKVCVCADESASSISDVIGLIQDHAVGAINIKLMKTGLIHGFQIARLASAHGLKLMMGGMMESNVAMTAAAHLACGVGGFDFIDLDTPFFIKGEAARNPYLTSSGIYDLTKVKAGIGIKPLIN
ncbi:MAG: dipeptide epimerase [Candidatus Omnitrophica bacterium]|nr:dipeptide epimerase [Candidatus Omnitrophota bacterium]